MAGFAELLSSESAFKLLIKKGIWGTYSSSTQKLHPIHNYFHAPSGLHNEGVWHNYIMGLSYYLCLPLYKHSDPSFCKELEEVLEKVNTNVWKLNFDEKLNLFKSRSNSGYWDHSVKQAEQKSNATADGISKEKVFLVTENEEKKCIANCIAGLFYACYSTQSPVLDPMALFQTIQKEFYNSQYQLFCSKLEKRTHFRAVDHALLALLAVKLKQDSVVQTLVNNICNDFEFKNLANKDTSLQTCNYIDGETKNNSPFLWQDSWILIGLIVATKYLASSVPTTATVLHQMILNTYDKYLCSSDSIPQLKGCSGMASEPMSRKAVYLSHHCFTGDQAVFLAMIHIFDSCFPGILGDFKEKHTKDAIELFDKILFKSEAYQFSISEKYHSAALWTSTETILSLLLVQHPNELVPKLFF